MNHTLPTLCILNCVEDAQSFLAEFGDSEKLHWQLVSTHGSVNDYLATRGLGCLELSSLLTHQMIKEFLLQADEVVNKLLTWLDSQLAPIISSTLHIPKMDYFKPIYRYDGKAEYLGLLKLDYVLRHLFQSQSFRQVLVYQSTTTSFLVGNRSIVELVQRLAKQYEFTVFIRHVEPLNQIVSSNQLTHNFIKFIQRPDIISHRLYQFVLERFPFQFSPDQQTILLFNQLYDLRFLISELPKRFNVVLWSRDKTPNNLPVENRINHHLFSIIQALISAVDINALNQVIGRYSNLCTFLLIKFLLVNILEYLPKYLQAVIILHRLYQQYPIDLGVWGNLPLQNGSSLVNEYLLKVKIPIIGMQHGASYGIQHDVICQHFDSDYSHCTHFFTYGFDKKDLEQAVSCQQKSVTCEIIPVGSSKEHRKIFWQKKKRSIDVLFPMTITMSLTYDDIVGLKQDLLADYQRNLLRILDTFEDLDIVIKLLPGYVFHRYCSVGEMLKKVKPHIKVINDITFLDCLDKYEIKSLVLERPATPLYEAIGRDMEIFVMADPMLPFNPAARQLLEKRVHYFEDITAMQAALVKWSKGELPVLRDDGFYRKYVFRENTTELILQTIENLLSAKGELR